MEIQEQTRIALAELFPASTPADTPPVVEGTSQDEAPPRAPGVLVTDFNRCGAHLDVLCRPDQVVDVARIMDERGFFLEAVTGVDWIDRNQLEVIYDYNRLGGESCRVMVRACLPRTEPVVPTISGVFPAADWHERETLIFMGFSFRAILILSGFFCRKMLIFIHS